MKRNETTKQDIRSRISSEKKQLGAEKLAQLSDEVMMTLEMTDVFCKARNVLIYHSLKDEVQTLPLVERYAADKQFYLPVVVGKDLVFRRYTAETTFSKSDLGVLEPDGEDLTDYRQIDMIVVPGVAFDRRLNRMGRGGGYYDRFLANVKIPKVAVCFDFQIVDGIPLEPHDIAMDMLVSETEIVSNGFY
ncbi:5-formyltetrahydrofolate cyclo-ligase [Dysgonomonas sp. PH5-45]|uniref:5-formyltetrahydrofolate cyclo-ligase n=1 Tax=unclassified Dysgonomonas TaxID=2630389 RepID=UPI00247576DB|nr:MULTISPECIES: 5-formyltetrahydrofolate cyclo-ligase [unclassified Dysgonomonas]MDH6354371.1 5-formyltetrahydrofolate cyclo-ligase [Dysgonomonas sp. PH5-45]MDH6387271.1 5-formyltetrahydrofolate cyclo-ligase [Dysgonomonas sp. PH5-37]